MTDEEIRPLILEVLAHTRDVEQYASLERVVRQMFVDSNLGPFGQAEHVQLKRILWDLSVERIISWGTEGDSDARWPFFHITPFGREFLNKMTPHFLDPDGYVGYLKTLVPNIDDIVLQYAQEASKAFRAQLWFASAVMLGAASERVILLLLEAVRDKTSGANKARLTKLLEQPKLTEIFKSLQARINEESKAGNLPYSVHQGSTEHIISLAEMIRVHRNEAVHPAAAKVDRQKIFISLQTFPEALRIIVGIIKWFTA